MPLHLLDAAIIIIYFLLIWILGFWKKSSSEISDYLLMGRRLSLPAFVMTLVSTWYGGILGVSEFSFNYGISNWIVFGVPYYVFGLIFAFFLAERARKQAVNTIPHLLRRTYGEKSGILGAIQIFFLASPAPYLLTLGFLFRFFFNWPLAWSILAGLIFSTLYILRGGLGSVVRTDIFQFLLMYLGFFIMALVGYHVVGSWQHLTRMLPSQHLSVTGGHSAGFILVWFFIALWTLVDPGFHQRVYAAKDARVAKRGVLIAVGCWFVFDLLTTYTGLLARALLPANTAPGEAFLRLSAHILPVGIQGLFLLGIFATVMSTLDSTALVTAQTLGYDLLARSNKLKRHSAVNLTRVGLGLSLIFAFILAIALPSVVKLWYALGTILIPGLLLPVLSALYPPLRISARFIEFSMILSPLVAWLWFVFAKVDSWQYLGGLEPFYPGILTSIVIWFMGFIAHKHSLNMRKVW